METYTTTTDNGRTLELEIVQNAPAGYAVNFHQLEECVGYIEFAGDGYRAVTELGTSGKRVTLTVTPDRFAALAAIIDNLTKVLAEFEEAEVPASQDPADAEQLTMDELDPEVYGEHYSPAAIRDICRRAAFDMGIRDRRAHPDMLPAIAFRAAEMIRFEMRYVTGPAE